MYDGLRMLRFYKLRFRWPVLPLLYPSRFSFYSVFLGEWEGGCAGVLRCWSLGDEKVRTIRNAWSGFERSHKESGSLKIWISRSLWPYRGIREIIYGCRPLFWFMATKKKPQRNTQRIKEEMNAMSKYKRMLISCIIKSILESVLNYKILLIVVFDKFHFAVIA